MAKRRTRDELLVELRHGDVERAGQRGADAATPTLAALDAPDPLPLASARGPFFVFDGHLHAIRRVHLIAICSEPHPWPS